MRSLVIGLIWFAIFLARFSSIFQAEGNLRSLEGKQVRLIGNISSEPLLQGSQQKFNLGKVKVVADQYPEYRYGQKISVFGSLQRKVVNRWYSRFSLMYPDVQLVKADKGKSIGFDWKETVLGIRRRIELVFNQTLPEPEASLLAGIVLGIKRDLSQDFWQALQRTGTLHIVVASGYNVTVVMGTTILYLAGLVKRRTAIIIAMLMVVGYAVMAGAEPAIVRAGIMGSLAYLGQMVGRKADGVRMLVISGGGMLLYNPIYLFDIGFQLSFLATLGLLLISTSFERFLGEIWLIGKDMSQTLSAQIMVWPILVINFHQMSVFSILVNSLILWLVPIIMNLGMGLALVGSISLGLGRIVGWLVYGPLHLMAEVINWFGSKTWMSFELDMGGGYWWLVAYYGILWLVLKRFAYGKK